MLDDGAFAPFSSSPLINVSGVLLIITQSYYLHKVTSGMGLSAKGNTRTSDIIFFRLSSHPHPHKVIPGSTPSLVPLRIGDLGHLSIHILYGHSRLVMPWASLSLHRS